MARFLGILLVIVLIIAGVGYYLEWFTLSTHDSGQNTDVKISLDKKKVQEDEERAKEKARELEEKAKKKVDDLRK
jgi:uncharacterized protein YxeA